PIPPAPGAPPVDVPLSAPPPVPLDAPPVGGFVPPAVPPLGVMEASPLLGTPPVETATAPPALVFAPIPLAAAPPVFDVAPAENPAPPFAEGPVDPSSFAAEQPTTKHPIAMKDSTRIGCPRSPPLRLEATG